MLFLFSQYFALLRCSNYCCSYCWTMKYRLLWSFLGRYIQCRAELMAFNDNLLRHLGNARDPFFNSSWYHMVSLLLPVTHSAPSGGIPATSSAIEELFDTLNLSVDSMIHLQCQPAEPLDTQNPLSHCDFYLQCLMQPSLLIVALQRVVQGSWILVLFPVRDADAIVFRCRVLGIGGGFSSQTMLMSNQLRLLGRQQ